MTLCRRSSVLLFAGLFTALALLASRPAPAHCDTLDGPVVRDARLAIEKRDVTPVLKWVKKDSEGPIREAFAQTLAVRALGPEARDLADRYFFETLVRIHREGEGAPYTGLKPAGEVEPGIAAADKALETGSSEALVKAMTGHVAEGITERYSRAAEARKHQSDSVEAGREYVEAYVLFIHYVERLHADAASDPGHHAGAAAPEAHGH